MKIVITTISTVCLMLVAVMGSAQQVAIPVLSFLADDGHHLRPLIGVAGSASLGGKFDLGFEVLQAAIPPQHEYVLATTGGDKRAVFVDLRESVLSAQYLSTINCDSDAQILLGKGKASKCAPDALVGIDRIVLSSTGSAALLFNASANRLYAFNNLPLSPVFAGRYELANLGSVTAFSISDDGRTVAVAVSDGDAGSLFLLSPYSWPTRVASMRHASTIKFLRNSDVAVIADDVDNTVHKLSDGAVSLLATANEGVSKPVGIAVSQDNQRIFVGNSATASVLTIGLNNRSLVSTDCHCAITGLYPTSSDGVFRITDFSGAPVVLFDGSADAPRLMFAPINPQ